MTETKIDIHLRKMKNKKKCSAPKISTNRPAKMHHQSVLFYICRAFELKSKPNLTENEKIELYELTEFIKEDNKRQTRNLNKRFCLPEDTPPEVSRRLFDLKLRLKAEKIKIETRAIKRECKEREKKFKREIEQMNKDAWKAHELSLYKYYKDGDTHYVENTPIIPEEKIECSPCISSKCPPPLKNKAKKNKLLNMATG